MIKIKRKTIIKILFLNEYFYFVLLGLLHEELPKFYLIILCCPKYLMKEKDLHGE
jgi:hypothetical protein